MDDIRKQFRSEALTHLQKAEELIQSYASDPSATDHLTQANRHFHALKGSSPLVGARPVSEVARTVEACLKRILSEPGLFTPTLHSTLRFALTMMQRQIDDFVAGQPIRDGETVIRTIRSHLPTTRSVEELLQNVELMSRELRNSLGETMQSILGKELEEGKRLYILHVPPHDRMQDELPRIREAMKDCGSILSVAGREEGSIHILLSSSSETQTIRTKLEGFQAILTELLSHEKIAELPVTETTRPAPPPVSTKQEGKFRVLFADDSQITRDLYRILLQRNGYQVELAKDGAEALQMLRSSSFDAVITDDQMPAMDGSEFLRAAKNDERLYHVPFIFMSGHATDEARSKAMKFGAAAYLVKGGFEKEQLLVILKEAIEKAQG